MSYLEAIDREKIIRYIDEGNGARMPSNLYSQAWEHVKNYMGEYVGYTLLILVFSTIFAYFMAFSPFGYIFNNFINPIIFGVLLSGFYIFTYKASQHKDPEFGDLFKGFISNTSNLILFYIITLIVSRVILLPILFIGSMFTEYTFGNLISIFILGATQSQDLSLMSLHLINGIISILIYSLFYFGPFFIIFGQMTAMEAVSYSSKLVSKSLGGVIGFVLIGAGIIVLGLLAFCIGILWAMPVLYAAGYMAFEYNFRIGEHDDSELDDVIEHLL